MPRMRKATETADRLDRSSSTANDILRASGPSIKTEILGSLCQEILVTYDLDRKLTVTFSRGIQKVDASKFKELGKAKG